ncbi:hypothetical protein HOE425_333053 [Hoeflea sp. EC-HK425]|nr:hypothetical protein HOE425_333053 [Hoeflea sp. EC-HK425]
MRPEQVPADGWLNSTYPRRLHVEASSAYAVRVFYRIVVAFVGFEQKRVYAAIRKMAEGPIFKPGPGPFAAHFRCDHDSEEECASAAGLREDEAASDWYRAQF